MRRIQAPQTARVLLGATVLLAFGLRVFRLAGQSIWYDEGLSVYYARRPLPELLSLVLGSDHPPLYFFLLHVWLRVAAFGEPAVEFLVRFPSVFFGVLVVALIFALGRRLLGEPAGLAAGALTAISPFHVWYSQETRMYTLVTLLALWSSFALWTSLQSPVSSPHPLTAATLRRWTPYGLTLCLALYAHFYAGLVLLAHATFVTWWACRRRNWVRWLEWAAAAALAVGVFLPWGGLAAGQLQANDTFWRGTLDLGRTLSEALRAFAVGETVVGPMAHAGLVAYLLLALAGLLAGRQESGSRAGDVSLFLVAYLLIPLVVLFAMSFNRPKFAPRYLLMVTPALALLAGQGAVCLGRRAAGWRQGLLPCGLAAILMGGVVAASGLALWRHFADDSQFKPDWRAAASYVNRHATPRDAVVIVAGHTLPAFDFYNTRRLDVYPIPPRLLPTVSDPVETADVVDTLNRLIREGHDRVWLILWQEPLADPRRLTLDLLFDHGHRQGITQGFHGLGMLLFELPAGTVFEPPQPGHRVDALFGAGLRLEGFDLAQTAVAAGETLTLRLYWRTDSPMREDYTAFTQLLSPEDRIVGQHDRRLGGDLYPTSRWPVGEPVRETYELTVAAATTTGRYRLITGAYLPSTLVRLPAAGNNAAGDHVVVAEIEVFGTR